MTDNSECNLIDFSQARTEITHNGWGACGKYLTINAIRKGKCQVCNVSINREGISK